MLTTAYCAKTILIQFFKVCVIFSFAAVFYEDMQPRFRPLLHNNASNVTSLFHFCDYNYDLSWLMVIPSFVGT